MKTVVFFWPANYPALHPHVFNSILEYRGLINLIRSSVGGGFSVMFTDDIDPELIKTVEEDFQNVMQYFGEKNYTNIIERMMKVPASNNPMETTPLPYYPEMGDWFALDCNAEGSKVYCCQVHDKNGILARQGISIITQENVGDNLIYLSREFFEGRFTKLPESMVKHFMKQEVA